MIRSDIKRTVGIVSFSQDNTIIIATLTNKEIAVMKQPTSTQTGINKMERHFIPVVLLVLIAVIANLPGMLLLAKEQPKIQISKDESINLCPDPTFSNATNWHSPRGYKIAPSAGLNGNSALLVERTNPKSYTLLNREIEGLKRNTAYDFGVWVKGEKINLEMKGMDKRGGTVCIEFYEKDKHIGGGSYPLGVYGTQKWTLIKGKVTTPKEFDKATICFYLGKYTIGKAWFYSPYIRQDAPYWKVGLLCPVMNYAIKPGQQELIFSSFLYGLKADQFEGNIDIVRDGNIEQKLSAPIKDNRFEVLAKLKPGEYLLELSLVNKKDKKISLRKEVSIQVLDPVITPPKNSVFVDNRGRTWINGKKFLPIGLYTNQRSDGFKKWNHKWRTIDTENLKNSPFNCIMPYDGMSWQRESSELSGIDAQREIMDELNNNGIKVIFSVKDIRNTWDKWQGANGMNEVVTKVVETFRDHPALLAWYTNDEKGVEQLDLDKRKLIGKLDPFHPTWQVQCVYYRFNEYQGAADVFGVDPYPIVENAKDMKLVQKNMDLAMKAVGFNGEIALWAVPQIFPWSQHRDFEPLCWPTETQVRSMSLLMAIMGSKGFVMFAYPSLFKGKETNFEQHWPEYCNAAQALLDISPFILGDPIGPTLQIETIKGEVMAKAFTSDNGKTCVIITAIGPGQAEATIKFKGANKLKSKYDRSILNKNGSWTFKGEDIDSDVLFPIE